VGAAGEATELGEISGSADVVFSQGLVNLVVIVKGGNGYRYNATDGLVQIADEDYLPSDDVDFIDGRHVFVASDGYSVFYSEVDAGGDIEPLSYFDAQELPDKNKCVINISNQILIGGEHSFEAFRTQIDPDAVFTRREGGRVDVGFVSAKTRFLSTFAFLGRRRGEGFRFYAMGSGDAQPISNEAIDELINEQYTLKELQQGYAERFEYKGHEVIVFNLARHSLGFSNGAWFYLDSTIDGKPSPWRVKGISHAYGKYICGDAATNNVGVIGNVSTEYGGKVESEIQTFIRGERNAYFSVKNIEADCLVGQSAIEGTIGLSISRDGRTWSDYHYRGLGKQGQYSRLVKWQFAGGIGTFENMCGIRLRTTADVNLPLEALTFQ
jgi:hypothetical protein